MKRKSYIDWQAIARSFNIGDLVRVYDPATGIFSPWEAVITATHPGIGMLDVETPYGNVRLPAEELVLTSRDVFLEPSFYDSYDIQKSMDRQKYLNSIKERQDLISKSTPKKANNSESRLVKAYMAKVKMLMPRIASIKASSEIDMWNKASSELGAHTTDTMIRQALYWVAKGRQYSATRSEIESGIFTCPVCKEELKKAIYKLRTSLYVCPNSECLFCIKPSDVIDRNQPDDAPEELTTDDEGFFEPGDSRLTPDED
jgi:hypothetical protein